VSSNFNEIPQKSAKEKFQAQVEDYIVISKLILCNVDILFVSIRTISTKLKRF
jgi:hypothetical protein